MLHPQIFEVKGGFPEVLQAFKDGHCRAAVVRGNAYKKLPDEDRKVFKVIFKSPSYPNQTVTVGGRINGKKRDRLIAALTKKDLPAGEKIFEQFSKSARFFIPAKPADYQDMETMLEGVVWGW
jgi:ABC-type phosphate/phosphonate transport system substrate-binding protein